MATGDGENAVRTYLLYLEDPATVVDRAAVKQVEAAIRTAKDPIEKLHLITELRRVSEGSEEEIRQAFCAHAKEWAEKNNVDASSFVELGVDAATMRAAGFTVKTSTAAARAKAGRQPTNQTRRVRVGDVKAMIVARRPGEFTLAEVAGSSGGSAMTVRRAVEQLIDAGQVERLGPARDWVQQGRAPIIFRRASALTANV